MRWGYGSGGKLQGSRAPAFTPGKSKQTFGHGGQPGNLPGARPLPLPLFLEGLPGLVLCGYWLLIANLGPPSPPMASRFLPAQVEGNFKARAEKRQSCSGTENTTPEDVQPQGQ